MKKYSLRAILFLLLPLIVFINFSTIYFGVINHHRQVFLIVVSGGGVLLISLIFLILKEMIYSLKESQAALEEAKTVSEIKVQARTRELKEISGSLEEQVKERTEELQEKIAELERFQKIAVGRELKMLGLKEKIKELENES